MCKFRSSCALPAALVVSMSGACATGDAGDSSDPDGSPSEAVGEMSSQIAANSVNAKFRYLVGDWNGNRTDNLAVRRGNRVLMDVNFDGLADFTQTYGSGNSEDQYLVGDWDGNGTDNLAVRRGNRILMDVNFDGLADFTQTYGSGNSEDQYLVGDWDGNRTDNLAVRRGNSVLMDFNFDGQADFTQIYGNGNSEDP